MLSTKRRVSRASLLSVSTTMPSKTGVVQAVWTPRAFSTETTHMRQAPTLRKVGMMAQRGDANARVARRFQDRAAIWAPLPAVR
jgi:hypothetical protein